jgi:hypothetical protein
MRERGWWWWWWWWGKKVKWELVYGSPTTVDPVLAVGAIYKSAERGAGSN